MRRARGGAESSKVPGGDRGGGSDRVPRRSQGGAGHWGSGKREAWKLGSWEAGKLRSCGLENEEGRIWNRVVVSQLDVSKKNCFLGRDPVLFFSLFLLLFDEIESGARLVQNKAPTPGVFY